MPASVKSPVFTSMVHRKVQPQTAWQGEGRERREERERERRLRKKKAQESPVSSSRRSCVLVYNSLFFLEGKGSVTLVESEGAAQTLQDFGPGHVPKRTVMFAPWDGVSR